MKETLSEYIRKFQKKHRDYRRYAVIFSILAVITVLGVNWELHQKGISMTENAIEMTTQVTGMSGAGTKYDTKGNLYSSDLRIDFTFDEETVQQGGLEYYYEYPDGIIVPDGLLDTEKDLYDANGKKAGVYYFEKTEDGKYRVGIRFDQTYVSEAQEDIKGYIQFSGQVDASKADDDGNIKIEGKDKVTLEIPKDEITYPDGETNRYDITTTKKGSYEAKDGKLVYTVYVYSLKGTPGTIDFEDQINADGLTLGDPDVKVTKETMKRYSWGDGTAPESSEEVSVNYNYADGTLDMTLPQIDPAKHVDETANEKAYDLYTRYKIKYTYDVSDIPDGKVNVNNTVSTVSTNNKTTVKAEASKEIEISAGSDSMITKSGVGAGEKVDYITWTITVNKGKKDIAGATLKDDMLSKLIPGHFSVSPSEGYEAVKDDDGNITAIKFKEVEGGKNTNTYTITYRAPAQKEWGEGAATNTATITPAGSDTGEDATAEVKFDGVWVGKTMDGAEDIEEGKTVAVSWTVKIVVPADKMPAGTVIKDDPTKDQWDTAGNKQYLPHEQVLKWADGIYWANSGEKK